jgi:hypothetical protein
MRVRVYFGTGLAAATLVLMSSVTLAQAAQSTDAKKLTVAPNGQANSINPAHQDQFGHASNVAASGSTEHPVSTAEAKKHIAGVKYEDRAATSNGAQTGTLDAKGTQEKHVSSTPVRAVNPQP